VRFLVQVEIWSDVVCPWCAVGRARFQRALEAFDHADEVRVRWRSFELDPAAPRERPGSQRDHLAAKYGRTPAQAQEMLDQMTATAAEEGLSFRFDRARAGNTFDAHRLLHLAHDVGARDDRPGLQDEVKDALLAGYLRDGEPIGDPDALTRLAVAAGLDHDAVSAVLAGDRYADEVRADEDQARAFGISAVPFFVLDRRYGVSGAQPTEVLLGALREAWGSRSALTPVGGAGHDPGGDSSHDHADHDHAAHDHAHDDACVDGSCAV
jgi:predicted DsbA family dithiol-disulfide isomerase